MACAYKLPTKKESNMPKGKKQNILRSTVLSWERKPATFKEETEHLEVPGVPDRNDTLSKKVGNEKSDEAKI